MNRSPRFVVQIQALTHSHWIDIAYFDTEQEAREYADKIGSEFTTRIYDRETDQPICSNLSQLHPFDPL